MSWNFRNKEHSVIDREQMGKNPFGMKVENRGIFEMRFRENKEMEMSLSGCP